MRKDDQGNGGANKAIAEKINEACKGVVLVEEVANLKKQLTSQLAEAKDNLATAKQQTILWDTRVKQILGSISSCNTLLQKSQKPTTLVLQDDHNRKGRK